MATPVTRVTSPAEGPHTGDVRIALNLERFGVSDLVLGSAASTPGLVRQRGGPAFGGGVGWSIL